MRTIVVVALIVGLSSTAWSEPGSSASSAEQVSKDCARAKAAGRTCILDMTAEDISSEGFDPDGENLNVYNIATHGSLIKIREHFLDKLLESVRYL